VAVTGSASAEARSRVLTNVIVVSLPFNRPVADGLEYLTQS